MIVYRLSLSKYALDLSGRGAALAGGRWNSKGIWMVYTSDSRALCMAELAVHLPIGLITKEYQMIRIFIPDSIPVSIINSNSLSKDWSLFPHSLSTKLVGDAFIKESKYAILKVPSAVVQGDFNYLINPNHKHANKIKIQKAENFLIDKRMFKL